MRRILLTAVMSIGLTVPATITAVGTSSQPAFAYAPVSCQKAVGTGGHTITFSECSPRNGQNKSLTGRTTVFYGGRLRWSPSRQTTVISATIKLGRQGGCPSGSIEARVRGTVTGGTSSYTHVGDAVAFELCANASFKLRLVPHTVAMF